MTTQQANTRTSATHPLRAPRATRGHRGAAASCATLAVLLAGAAHLRNPGLSPADMPISELALHRDGWLMKSAFGSWALAAAAAGWSLWRTDHGRVVRSASVLVWLTALGPILALVFDADSLTTPGNPTTANGAVHAVGAALSDLLLPASLLLSWKARAAGPLHHRSGLVWGTSGFLWLAALTLVALLAIHQGQLVAGAGMGWANRAHVASCLAFLVAASVAGRGSSVPPTGFEPVLKRV